MTVSLLGATEIRRLAAELDVTPTKKLGQNFVVDANTVRKIVHVADVRAGEHVVEIGPGLGSLTLAILETGATVTAVEIDHRLAEQLPETVAARMPDAIERLRVVDADAMRVSELPGPAPTALVANLPYNVSVPVLLHMLETVPTWTSGLVMVQLEVADRLAARPGSKVYGVPSAKVAWYAETSRVGTVPPKVFWPVPNVDSGLVRLVRHEAPEVAVARQQVFSVVDAAFAQRRKMLRQALSGLFGSSATAEAAITVAGQQPTARGETLDIAAFAAIASQLPK